MASLVILGKDEDGTGHLPLQEKPSHLQFLLSHDSEIRVSSEPSVDAAAILLRVSGHWVVISHPGGDPLVVNGVPVVSLKIVDHGDILQVNGARLRLSELCGDTLTMESPHVQQQKACPVCLGSFQAGDKVLFCPLCGTGHHDECFRRNHKCANWPLDGFVLPEEEWRDRKEAGI